MTFSNFMYSLLISLIPPKIQSWPKFVFYIHVHKAISLSILNGFQQTRAQKLTEIV